MAARLQTCLEAALKARESLIAEPAITAYRVFNGQADGIPGLVIERLGDVLVVQLHEGTLTCDAEQVRAFVEHAHQRLGTRAVYRKRFVRDRSRASAELARLHTNPQPWLGERVEPERIVVEYGLKFLVRPYDGFSVGLFLEHRENRRRIRGLAAGLRVLNAFSYTGGFTVAAAAGGAAAIASVDVSKRYLEWSKHNLTANGIDLTGLRFYRSDIFAYYKRARRQGHRYTLIILDPPTFARSPRSKRVFVLTEQLEALAAGAMELLDPGGIVLLATNDRRIDRTRLEAVLTKVGAGRSCTILESPALPRDFAGDPDYSKTVIARFG